MLWINFKLFFTHEKEQSIEHNSSTKLIDPIDFANSIRNEDNIKQKRRQSPVINLYPQRDVFMHHTNNIAAGKPNVPQIVPGNSSFTSVTKYDRKMCYWWQSW